MKEINGLKIIHRRNGWHVVAPNGKSMIHVSTEEKAVRLAQNTIYLTSFWNINCKSPYFCAKHYKQPVAA